MVVVLFTGNYANGSYFISFDVELKLKLLITNIDIIFKCKDILLPAEILAIYTTEVKHRKTVGNKKFLCMLVTELSWNCYFDYTSKI